MASNKEDQKTEEIVVKQPKETSSAVSDFMEDPMAQAEDVYSKYKKPINIAGTVFLLAVAAFVGWKYYITTQEQEAQAQMFQSVYYFEADSISKALNGDGNYPGLIEIADSYGMTKAGNLAKFYSGLALLKQGKFEDAEGYLKDFSSNDYLVQGRAYCLLGDVNMELKKYDEAAKYYDKASDYNPNKEFTPGYLIKLGLAQEKANNMEGALETYSKILEKYPNSMAATEAKRCKGYVEGMLGK